MNYKQLKLFVNELDESQLMDDVSIAIIGSAMGGVEVMAAGDFVNPKTLCSENDGDYREAVYLDEIEDSILDEGHAYITVLI